MSSTLYTFTDYRSEYLEMVYSNRCNLLELAEAETSWKKFGSGNLCGFITEQSNIIMRARFGNMRGVVIRLDCGQDWDTVTFDNLSLAISFIENIVRRQVDVYVYGDYPDVLVTTDLVVKRPELFSYLWRPSDVQRFPHLIDANACGLL